MPMSLRVEIFPADLDATVEFYRDVLGSRWCATNGRQPPLTSLERDTVRIGAAARADVGDRTARRPPVGIEVVLEVDDLLAERTRVAAAGWPVTEEVTTPAVGAARLPPAGPSGYYLRITSRTA